MGIVHDLACVERRRAERAAEQAFYAQYPDACRTCRGSGIVVSFEDPSPAGVSLGRGSYEVRDGCRDCTERKLEPRCPRCATVLTPEQLDLDPDTEALPCGHRLGEGLPEPVECLCWAREFAEACNAARDRVLGKAPGTVPEGR